VFNKNIFLHFYLKKMHRKKVEQQYSIILVSWCLGGKIPEQLAVFYTIWTASCNRYNFFLFLRGKNKTDRINLAF